MQRQSQHGTGLQNILRHGDIRLRRIWIARWVIVDEDQSRGVQVQGAPDDLARIDRHVIDSADAKAFIGDESVLAVQIQNVKSLDIPANRQRIMQTSA